MRVEKRRGEGRALGIAKAGKMRPSRRENAKIPSQAGVVSPLDEYLATETMGLRRTRQFQRRVALARETFSAREDVRTLRRRR